MDNFKIKELVSATYSIDNSSDSSRTFAISAEVHVSNQRVQSIQKGKVMSLSDTAPHTLADFSDYGNLSSNIFSALPDGVTRTDVFEAISSFCNGLRTQTIEPEN